MRSGHSMFVAGAMLLLCSRIAQAAGTPAQQCEAAKDKAAGKYMACRLTAASKAVTKVLTTEYTKCDDKLAAAYTKAEVKAVTAGGICPTTGDVTQVRVRATGDTAAVAAETSGTAPTALRRLPATGQMECWGENGSGVLCAGTGYDGDVRAGASLAYTDNLDGTVTDNNTGLMWEKLADDGSIHDKDNTYRWVDAFAVKVAALNAGSFAGHTDWRMPNVKELQSIIDYATVGPAVSLAFNTNCTPACTVTTCSCTVTTQSQFYWSSTNYGVNFPGNAAAEDAYGVFFNLGVVDADVKSNSNNFVRAVRGGL